MILNNKSDCIKLVSRIDYRVPSRRTRRRDLFVSDYRLRVSQIIPISRMSLLVNNSDIDVFSIPAAFRRISTVHISLFKYFLIHLNSICTSLLLTSLLYL